MNSCHTVKCNLVHDAILIRAVTVTKQGGLTQMLNGQQWEMIKPQYTGVLHFRLLYIKKNKRPKHRNGIQADYFNFYTIASHAVSFLNKVYEFFSDIYATPVFNDVCEQLISVYEEWGVKECEIINLSTQFVPKVIKQSSIITIKWELSPQWWNGRTKDNSRSCCQDDIDLLAGILDLDYGYGGFYSQLCHDYSCCKQLSAIRNDCSSMFTQ